MSIPRNKPCACGSGKKAKKCCLFLAEQKVAEERKQARETWEKYCFEQELKRLTKKIMNDPSCISKQVASAKQQV